MPAVRNCYIFASVGLCAFKVNFLNVLHETWDNWKWSIGNWKIRIFRYLIHISSALIKALLVWEVIYARFNVILMLDFWLHIFNNSCYNISLTKHALHSLEEREAVCKCITVLMNVGNTFSGTGRILWHCFWPPSSSTENTLLNLLLSCLLFS